MCRRALGQIDNDQAKGATAQEQLCGLDLRKGQDPIDGGGYLDHEQGVEVDPILCEVGWKERAAHRLNPSRGFTLVLRMANESDCGGCTSAWIARFART